MEAVIASVCTSHLRLQRTNKLGQRSKPQYYYKDIDQKTRHLRTKTTFPDNVDSFIDKIIHLRSASAAACWLGWLGAEHCSLCPLNLSTIFRGSIRSRRTLKNEIANQCFHT